MIEFVILIGVSVSALLFTIYWLLTKVNNYWNDRGIPFIEPAFIFGSIKDVLLNNESWTDFSSTCFRRFKTHQYGGAFFFTIPVLYICDLKIIEKILVEDFSFFKDRLAKSNNNFGRSESLTFGQGEKWHERRLKVAPAFGPTRVRGMFQQLYSAAERTLEQIRNHNLRKEPLEVESFAVAYTMNVITGCLFGVNTLDNSHESVLLKKALDQMYTSSKGRKAIMILGMKYSRIGNCLKFSKSYREAIGAYGNFIRDVVKFRLNSNDRRNDILQTMIDLYKEDESIHGQDKGTPGDKTKKYPQAVQNDKDNENLFSCEAIGGIMHNFIYGGIKPPAHVITFALFEIGRTPEIQSRVQQEIEFALSKYNGWSTEALEHMPYLDQVVQETLRLYGFNQTLYRVLTKPYRLPGTNVTLEEGMHVFVPIDAIHRDPEYYPEPEKFRPERFEGHNYKPTSTFLPFGQGPRICVAVRLAIAMVKLCLARILAEFEVKISNKMQLPLEFSNNGFYPRAKDGIWLEFVERKQVG